MGIVNVIYLGEEEVRHGGQQGRHPAEEGHQAGPSDVGEREDVERGADREVSLQGEGEDRHH